MHPERESRTVGNPSNEDNVSGLSCCLHIVSSDRGYDLIFQSTFQSYSFPLIMDYPAHVPRDVIGLQYM